MPKLAHFPPLGGGSAGEARGEGEGGTAGAATGTNCIKIGLPGKLILSMIKVCQEVLFSLRIDFPGRLIFIQLPPEYRRGRSQVEEILGRGGRRIRRGRGWRAHWQSKCK